MRAEVGTPTLLEQIAARKVSRRSGCAGQAGSIDLICLARASSSGNCPVAFLLKTLLP